MKQLHWRLKISVFWHFIASCQAQMLKCPNVNRSSPNHTFSLNEASPQNFLLLPCSEGRRFLQWKLFLSQKVLRVKSQILELPSHSQALLQLFTGDIYTHHMSLCSDHSAWFKPATDTTLYLTDLAKIPWKKLNRAPSTMKASQDSLKSTGQICCSPELQTFHPHQAGTVKPYSSHPLAFSNVWQAHEGILHSSQSLPRPLHGPKSSPSPWHHPKPSLFSSFPHKWPFGSYTWTVAYLKPKACGQLEGKDT